MWMTCVRSFVRGPLLEPHSSIRLFAYSPIRLFASAKSIHNDDDYYVSCRHKSEYIRQMVMRTKEINIAHRIFVFIHFLVDFSFWSAQKMKTKKINGNNIGMAYDETFPFQGINWRWFSF